MVIDRSDQVGVKSLRNLADVHVLFVDQLNTYDVLCSDDVVFTQSALTAFIDGTASSSVTTKAAAQEDTK